MKKRIFLLVGLLLGLWLTGGIFTVRADVAPPARPPGSSISPLGETQVRMLSERVEIEVHGFNGQGYLAEATSRARVRADFVMRNQGKTAEHMQVRFPLMNPNGIGDGFGNFPQITDLRAWVDGRSVITVPLTALSSNAGSGTPPPVVWAGFEAAFPPGREVTIRVDYSLAPTGYYPIATYAYILETGAGWKDTIGTADLILRLPYEAGEENVVLGEYGTTPGGQIVGKEIRWHFENLEPTARNNLVIDLVDPLLWLKALAAQKQVDENLQEAGAWARLAEVLSKACQDKSGKGWLRADTGGKNLAERAVYAYEKALALQDDPSLYSGYAVLLGRFMIQAYHSNGNADLQADDRNLQRLVQVLQIALTLEPDNSQVIVTRDLVAEAFAGVVAVDAAGQLSLRAAAPVTTPPAATAPGIPASLVPSPQVTPSALVTRPAAAPGGDGLQTGTLTFLTGLGLLAAGMLLTAGLWWRFRRRG